MWLSAWSMAAVSALCVLAPSLSFVSSPDGGTLTGYGMLVGSDGVVRILAPRLVGAMVAVPAAMAAAASPPSRRLGSWTVGALALLGQMTMSLEWLAFGRRITSFTGFGTLQIGWYVDLGVVVLGSVAMTVGASFVLKAVWTSRVPKPPHRLAVGVAAAALGIGLIWLLSRDFVFIASRAWNYSSPRLTLAALLPVWIVIVVGVSGPVLSVAMARRREVAVGVVVGWWAFLAVPWTQAVVVRAESGLPGGTPGAFWTGTALAIIGGVALIAWTMTPGSRQRQQPGSPATPDPEDWPIRTDEDPLRH